MLKWNRAWVALSMLILCSCAGSNNSSPQGPVPAAAASPDRLPALESSMMAVGLKRAWSGHYFPDATVEGAVVHGPDLFVWLFNANSRRYEIHCVDAARGTLRWMVDLGTTGVKYEPSAGDRFVVCVLDQGQGMIVINRATGAREFRMITPLKILPGGPAGSSESTVYNVSLADNRVHALNPDSGMTGWHWRILGNILGGPVMTPRLPKRLIVVGTDGGEIVALPASAWNEIGPASPAWSRKVLGGVSAQLTVAEVISPAGHDVSLLVSCEDKGLYCLDAATGDSRWVIRTSQPFRSQPQVAGGLAFARNLERLVVANIRTGEQQWKPAADGEALKPFETCEGVYAGDGERCYLSAGGKRVCRVDGRSGEVRAMASLDAFDMLVPAREANVLLGVTRDGNIVAFE